MSNTDKHQVLLFLNIYIYLVTHFFFLGCLPTCSALCTNHLYCVVSHTANMVQCVGFPPFHLIYLDCISLITLDKRPKVEEIMSCWTISSTATVQFDSGKCFLRHQSNFLVQQSNKSTPLRQHCNTESMMCIRSVRPNLVNHCNKPRTGKEAKCVMCGGEQLRLTSVTGASRRWVRAGTRCTGFGESGSRAAVETRLTLLTVGSLCVALTVQTHSWRTKKMSHD